MRSSRYFVALLACALLALGASQAAHAANTISAAVVAPQPTGPGQTFGVSLNLSSTDLPYPEVSGFQFVVYYDKSQVTLLEPLTDNTGQPAAGVVFPPMGAETADSLTIPGATHYRTILMQSLGSTFVLNAGPISQLNFQTMPTFSGSMRMWLLPLDDISGEGISDGFYEPLPLIYAIPDPLFDRPTQVYVKKSWAGTPAGTVVVTPDAINATFGYNAFDTVQGGVDAVAATGKVVVYDGGFEAENVTIAKALQFEGRAPLPPSPTVNTVDLDAGAVVTGSAGVTANTVDVNANTVLIANGILLAKSAGTVNLAAATFTENVVVDKPLTLAGAGQASTVIVPAVSAANTGGGSLGGSNIILVQANNVVIHDMTLDGDNPSLVSGIVTSGADLDARNGIITNHALGTFNGLEVYNTTVRNIYLRGIYASSGGSFNIHDNAVSNVQGEAASIAIMNWVGVGTITDNTVSDSNDAIASNHSSGVAYSGNIVTNCGSGIHTDNNGSSGGVADSIQNNTITNSKANGYGIFVFAPYLSVTVSGNTLTNVDVALASAGQYGGGATFSNNTIDGQGKAGATGMYATTSLFGWGSSNNTATVLSNNSIIGVVDGIYLEEDATYTCDLSATGNTIVATSLGVNVGAAAASLTGNTISGSATGVKVHDTGAITATGNTMSGNAVHFAFEVTAAGDSTANALAMPSRLAADMEAVANVNTVTGKTYITETMTPGGLVLAEASGLESYTYLRSTVQGSVNAAPAVNTVEVMAGTYMENVAVAEQLMLNGAGIDQAIISGPIGSPNASVRCSTASGMTLQGFTITREGNAVATWDSNLSVIGFAVQGGSGNATVQNNKFTGCRTAIDINFSNGNTVRNNIIDFNRTGIILRNDCLNNTVEENNITNNWTVGILWLLGAGDSAAGTQFFNNKFEGNWYAQVENRATTGGAKNFSANWFGTNSPATVNTNGSEPGYSALIPVAYGGPATPPGGMPTIRGVGLADVDYTPWLDAGTDTEVALGFQGDFSYLHVAAQSPQSGAVGRIQEGVNLLADGPSRTGNQRTAFLRDGLFLESKSKLNKPMTLLGESRSGVVIGPDNAAVPNGTDDGLIVQSGSVTVQRMTLDGAANAAQFGTQRVFRTAVNTDAALNTPFSDMVVTDCTIGNCWRRGVQTYYGSGVLASTGISVTNCSLSNFTDGPAVVLFNASAVVSNNVISNAPSGIEFQRLGSSSILHATVANNTLTGIVPLPSGAGGYGIQLVQTGASTVGPGNIIAAQANGSEVSDAIIVRNGLEAISVTANTATNVGPGSGLWMFGNVVPVAVSQNTFTGSAGASSGAFVTDSLTLAGMGSGGDLACYADFVQNTISGYANGVEISRSGTLGGAAVGVTIGSAAPADSNSIVATGTGVAVFDSNGQTAPNASVTVQNNATSIHGCAIGVDVNGGSATIANNAIYNNGIGVRSSGAAVATVTGNTMYDNPIQFAFGSAPATTVNTFAMASRLPADIESIINANTLTGKVYIGEGSPFTLVRAESGFLNVRNRIQASATAAVAGDTVRCPGDAVASRVTYPEQVSVNKALTFLGEPGITTVAGPATNAPIVDGQNAVGNGFAIVSAADDVAIRGFVVKNNASGGSNATGAGVWVSGSDSDRVTVADCDFQTCANGAIFGWVNSSNTIDGWSIVYNTMNLPTSGENGTIDLTNMINTTIDHNVIVGGYSNMILAADSNSAGPVGSGTVVSNNSFSGALAGYWCVALVSFNVQPLSGVVIRSNSMTAPADGTGVYISPQGATYPVSGVTIGGTGVGEGNTIGGSGLKRAVLAYGGYGPLSNVTISGNIVTMANPATAANALALYGVAGSSVVEANSVTVAGVPIDVCNGVLVYGPGTGTVQVLRNSLNGGSAAGPSGAGLALRSTLGASASITASENVISGFTGASGAAVSAEALTNSPTVTVLGNNLAGNTMAVLNAGAPTLNASANWHGVNTLAGVQGLVSASVVDYTPWLDVATDTNLVTAGFQGDFSFLHVAAASPQTGADGRIQEGVNLLADGSLIGGARIVDAKAGTYVENATLNKALKLQGPNLGKAGNDVTRVAEAVVMPAINDPDDLVTGMILRPTVRNITIDGLLLDGDNPSLSGGLAVNAADVNAPYPIENMMVTGDPNYHQIDYLAVRNCVIRNFFDGIYLETAFGVNRSWNYITNNKFVNGWEGIQAYALHTDISSNVFEEVNRGLSIHGGNAACDAGFVPQIAGNTVTVGPGWAYPPEYGTALRAPAIWVNYRRENAPAITVANNIVNYPNPVPAGKLARAFYCITVDGNRSVSFLNNTVNGSGNCPEAFHASACAPGASSVTVTGGAFNNIKEIGVGTGNAGWTYDGGDVAITVDNVPITMASGGAGYKALSSAGGAEVSKITIQGGATVSGAGATGAMADGAKARVEFAGASPVTFNSALAKYIELVNAGATNPATEIDATLVSFGGVIGSGAATLAQLFRVEDKVIHKPDAVSLGTVRVKTGHMYVTEPGTGPSDETVQGGVTAAVAADTVHVEKGVFAESVSIAKQLTVEGAQAGVDARTRSGAESTLTGGFSVTADGVTLDGLKVAGAANAVAVAGGLATTGVTVKNIAVDTASGNGIYAGAIGTPSLLIANQNLVVGAGGVGIGGNLANSFVTNNEVRDSTAVDATGIGGQFAVTSIENNKVNAITNGSAFALLYGPSANTTIQVNRFNMSKQGVFVDPAAPPAASVVLTRNHISKEQPGGDGAASLAASTLTANGNWWGHVFGPLATAATPLNNLTGRGTEVTGPVAFDPWYIKRNLALFSDAFRALNDRDGDGIWDADEDEDLDNALDTPETDRAVKDTDGDGVEDGVEHRAGTNPRDNLSFPGAPVLTDADADGLPSVLDANDSNPDSDGDRIKDGYEYSHNMSPSNSASFPAIGNMNNSPGATVVATVNILDVSLINQVLVGATAVTATSVYLDNADVNRSGNVSNADATIIRRFVGSASLQPYLPL